MKFLITLLVALPVIVLIWGALNYNRFVSLRNHIQNAWSNIDTELQRRYELIPNLVATVKGYAKHEEQVLQQVTQLRNQAAANHGTPSQQEGPEVLLVAAMSNLLMRVEAYPDLKADRNFAALQRELVNTEDRIQAARRFYNGNVREYETKRQTFPASAIAAMFNFGPSEYFNVEPASRINPQVNL